MWHKERLFFQVAEHSYLIDHANNITTNHTYNSHCQILIWQFACKTANPPNLIPPNNDNNSGSPVGHRTTVSMGTVVQVLGQFYKYITPILTHAKTTSSWDELGETIKQMNTVSQREKHQPRKNPETMSPSHVTKIEHSIFSTAGFTEESLNWNTLNSKNKASHHGMMKAVQSTKMTRMNCTWLAPSSFSKYVQY